MWKDLAAMQVKKREPQVTVNTFKGWSRKIFHDYYFDFSKQGGGWHEVITVLSINPSYSQWSNTSDRFVFTPIIRSCVVFPCSQIYPTNCICLSFQENCFKTWAFNTKWNYNYQPTFLYWEVYWGINGLKNWTSDGIFFHRSSFGSLWIVAMLGRTDEWTRAQNVHHICF